MHKFDGALFGGVKLVASFAMVLGFLGTGCSAELGSDGEDLGETSQELVLGSWTTSSAGGVVVGDSGGRGPLPVCRAQYDGGYQPGKLYNNFCEFGWGGKSHYNNNYQLLKDNGYHWVNPWTQDPYTGRSSVNLPSNAVDGGSAGYAAGGVHVGVCMAYESSDHTWHPGKFYMNKCNYARGGTATAGVTGDQLGDGRGKEYAVDPTANGYVKVLVK